MWSQTKNEEFAKVTHGVSWGHKVLFFIVMVFHFVKRPISRHFTHPFFTNTLEVHASDLVWPGFIAGLVACVFSLLGPLFFVNIDRNPTRWGRRKPWIYLIFVVESFLYIMIFWAPVKKSLLPFWYGLWTACTQIIGEWSRVIFTAWTVEVADREWDRNHLFSLVALAEMAGYGATSIINEAVSAWGYHKALLWGSVGQLLLGVVVQVPCLYWLPPDRDISANAIKELKDIRIVASLVQACRNPMLRSMLLCYVVDCFLYLPMYGVFTNISIWGMTQAQVGVYNVGSTIISAVALLFCHLINFKIDKWWIIMFFHVATCFIIPPFYFVLPANHSDPPHTEAWKWVMLMIINGIVGGANGTVFSRKYFWGYAVDYDQFLFGMLRPAVVVCSKNFVVDLFHVTEHTVPSALLAASGYKSTVNYYEPPHVIWWWKGIQLFGGVAPGIIIAYLYLAFPFEHQAAQIRVAIEHQKQGSGIAKDPMTKKLIRPVLRQVEDRSIYWDAEHFAGWEWSYVKKRHNDLRSLVRLMTAWLILITVGFFVFGGALITTIVVKFPGVSTDMMRVISVLLGNGTGFCFVMLLLSVQRLRVALRVAENKRGESAWAELFASGANTVTAQEADECHALLNNTSDDEDDQPPHDAM